MTQIQRTLSKNITQSDAWLKLVQHFAVVKNIHLSDLFAQDSQRFQQFSIEANEIMLDYSKNKITSETIDLLNQLAQTAELENHIEALFSGLEINTTEKRPALHTALRDLGHTPISINGTNIQIEIQHTLEKIRQFSDAIRNQTWLGFSGKPITDIVNIGIGGSDLGPLLVTEALASYTTTHLSCHFVSTIDGIQIKNILQKLNPETTLLIISSKSFNTQETLTNALYAKQWILNATDKLAKHMVAVTAEHHKAISFGISAENIFSIWPWVGGRYSVWSAVGLPAILMIGMDNFLAFLGGAHEMDLHFRHSPLHKNIPVTLALISIWYINFFETRSLAVLPYNYSLRRLIDYLQQLEMESNGKSVNHDGSPITYATAPVIWGQSGTNGQHAFHQLLYQGPSFIPVDFIVACRNSHGLDQHHTLLFANCISQSQALMQGKSYEIALQECLAAGMSQQDAQWLAKHKRIDGNRPSNTIVLSQLSPHNLGALIALYEHKIFVQGVIWGINSFDQWGVELGKQLTDNILPMMNNLQNNAVLDSSTQGLIRLFIERSNIK